MNKLRMDKFELAIFKILYDSGNDMSARMNRRRTTTAVARFRSEQAAYLRRGIDLMIKQLDAPSRHAPVYYFRDLRRVWQIKRDDLQSLRSKICCEDGPMLAVTLTERDHVILKLITANGFGYYGSGELRG